MSEINTLGELAAAYGGVVAGDGSELEAVFGSDVVVKDEADDSLQIDVLSGLFEDSADSGYAESTTTAESEEVSETETAPDGSAVTESADASDGSVIRFKAQYDHKEQDVELKHEELAGVWQRSKNMERAQSRAESAEHELETAKKTNSEVAAMARVMGFEGDNDADVISAMVKGITDSARQTQIDELVQNGTDRTVAETVVDLKMKGTNESAAEAEVTSDSDSDAMAEKAKEDVTLLLSMCPELNGDINNVPAEVFDAANQTQNLTASYLNWRLSQQAAETSKASQTNRVLRQNAASAKKAPVRGVSGQGSTSMKSDPLLSGLFGMD